MKLKDYKPTSRFELPEGKGKRVTCSDDAAEVFKALIGEDIKTSEHFVLLTLTGSSHITTAKVIHKGTLNQSLVHPRDIFYQAIGDNAAGILILHNHPSGTLEASRADIQITDRIKEASKIMGIELLDHIIVTEDGHYSFSEQGIL